MDFTSDGAVRQPLRLHSAYIALVTSPHAYHFELAFGIINYNYALFMGPAFEVLYACYQIKKGSSTTSLRISWMKRWQVFPTYL